jgi:hypothetical protein
MDLFVVPTIGFDLLNDFIILRLDRFGQVSLSTRSSLRRANSWDGGASAGKSSLAPTPSLQPCCSNNLRRVLREANAQSEDEQCHESCQARASNAPESKLDAAQSSILRKLLSAT